MRGTIGDPAAVPPDTGNEAWLLVSSAFVFMMVPALAFFYGGMVSSSAVISTMMLSFVSLAIGAVFWSLVGFSLAFGPPGATNVLGGMGFGAFDSSDDLRVNTNVSQHAFFIFQLAFNTITIAVISGGVVQRITLWAFALFSVLWSTLVYCPLAHWIFDDNGWLQQWGVLDFAGGLVVETSSGVSAFVLAFWLGPGQTLHGGGHHQKPHNIPFVLLGAGLLWVGWYGFNAGSALAAGYVAGRAFANTHLCASAAMGVFCLCQVLWDGPKLFTGKPSAIGAATGAVAGLVAITPACGYISQMFSLLTGVIAAVVSFWAIRAVKTSGVDDRLECLPVHGAAGALGILLTGLFANVEEDSPVNGAFYGNGMLFAKQLAALLVTVTLCVVMTTVCYWVVWAVAWVTGWPIRVPDDKQAQIDDDLHGEAAYHTLADAFSSALAGGSPAHSPTGHGSGSGGGHTSGGPLFGSPASTSTGSSTGISTQASGGIPRTSIGISLTERMASGRALTAGGGGGDGPGESLLLNPSPTAVLMSSAGSVNSPGAR